MLPCKDTPGSLLYRLGQKLLSKLARILAFVMGYHNVRIKGQLASSEEAPVIVVAPHLSFMDGIFTAVIGNLTYISRKENVDVPLFGRKFQLVVLHFNKDMEKLHTFSMQK